MNVQKFRRGGLATTCLAVACSLTPTLTHALEPGDWLVRVGAAHLSPIDDSHGLDSNPAADVGVDADTSLGINVTYMLTERVGIDVLGATPFEHDITGEGALSAAGTIASTKHLPPTVSLVYHFMPASSIRPYAGVGLNYTVFFEEETRGALTGVDLELDNSWGLTAQVGVDIDINDDWFFNTSLWYLDIDTTAHLDNAGTKDKVDVDIDPWGAMVSIGKHF